MLKTFAALAVIGTAGTALAQDEQPVTRERMVYTSNDYISVMGGVAIPDQSRSTANVGGNATFIFGNQFHENIALEGRFTATLFETGRGNGSDFYQYSGGLDLSFTPFDRRDERVLTPFALIGIVAYAEDVTPNSRDDSAFGGNVGLGVVSKPFLHNLRMRAEGRYLYSSFEKGFHDFAVNIGFELPLGRVNESLTVIPAEIETKVVEIEKPVPRKIIDTDGDTVEDAQDTCPNTPLGTRVDAAGCELPNAAFALRPVSFESSSLKLHPNAQSVLDIVARGLVAQPSMKLQIEGHSDLRGSKQANLDLSKQRAETVRDYLIAKGVNPSQLSVMAYGSSRPKVKPERTEDDRIVNRRVEFKVLSR